MKLQITILSAICLILLTACKPAPAKTYENLGIRFVCPAGWKITEDKHEDVAHFVYVEKNGFGDSGMITITWIDGEYEWEDYMDNIKETFEEKEMMQNLIFSDPSDTIFNGYDALTADYTFKIANLPHRGKVLIFGNDEKVINIVMQEATEDTHKNKEGFASFAESFSFQ